MRVVGFSFTKISGERTPEPRPNLSMSTDIEFINFEKENVEILRESEAINVSFKFSISYFDKPEKEKKEPKDKYGEIVLAGNIILAAEKEEVKEIMKGWKKKEVDPKYKVPLFNLIIVKCLPKSLQVEEELNLPLHVPVPQLRAQGPEGEKK